MKKITYTIIGLCALTFTLSACHKDHDVTTADPNTGKVFSVAGDQVGRPGIATVFVAAADKDNFHGHYPIINGPIVPG